MLPRSAHDFDAFYAEHHAYVRRVLAERGVQPVDLDDATQEAFVVVHRQLSGFEGRSSVETWLYAIARRVAANHRRKQRTDSERAPAPRADEEEPMFSPERVLASFSDIDDENRDLLALHEIGGLSISSLAELTGNARATIRNRLERGEAMLTRALTRRTAKPAQDAWIDVVTARFEHPPEPLAEGALRVLPNKRTCIATLDDIVIAVWRGQNSDEGLQAVIETMIAHAHARPEGMRYLSVVEPTSTPPTREGRAMMTWCARKLGAKIKAVAVTVEAKGLMSLVAPLMNTCIFLAREPINIHFFREHEASHAWLDQYGPVDPAALAQLITRMRSSLERSTSKPSVTAVSMNT